MAYRDLREFIKVLEENNEIEDVKQEVDLEYELGAICRNVLNNRGPALRFNKLKGTKVPIVSDIFATRKRLALAMETTEDKVVDEYIKRLNNPIPWKKVKTGPCKENIIKGDDVDLFKFSIPTWNDLDGGAFITLPCQTSKDPVDGWLNAGLYRTQVFNRNTVGILAVQYRHLTMQRNKVPNEPFPVALVIGADPSVHIASVAHVPYEVDEFNLAGGIRGEALEMVDCETIPVQVPAHAEIIIEGLMYPNDNMLEGPFGEFTGYYGIQKERPVIRVQCITHRNNPIHLATYEGRPPQDTSSMYSVMLAAETIRGLSLPGIKQLNVTEAGAGFNIVVQIDKKFEGYGKHAALAVLGTWPGRYYKTVIVVDDDIDPFNWTDVEWALGTRVQADRDVEIIKATTGIVLDPSLTYEDRETGHSRTARMIIDATMYDKPNYEISVTPKPDMWEKVLSEFSKYGIDVNKNKR